MMIAYKIKEIAIDLLQDNEANSAEKQRLNVISEIIIIMKSNIGESFGAVNWQQSATKIVDLAIAEIEGI